MLPVRFTSGGATADSESAVLEHDSVADQPTLSDSERADRYATQRLRFRARENPTSSSLLGDSVSWSGHRVPDEASLAEGRWSRCLRVSIPQDIDQYLWTRILLLFRHACPPSDVDGESFERSHRVPDRMHGPCLQLLPVTSHPNRYLSAGKAARERFHT